MADELIFLMQERQSRFYDLSSLESFGHFKLKSIEGDLPTSLDLFEGIVDDLPD
jgi:hypothetical protein